MPHKHTTQANTHASRKDQVSNQSIISYIQKLLFILNSSTQFLFWKKEPVWQFKPIQNPFTRVQKGANRIDSLVQVQIWNPNPNLESR